MQSFLTILYSLIPLYFIIFLGYIAVKKLSIDKKTIAELLIYIIAPVIIFYGTYQVELTRSNISLPFVIFIICCLISLIFGYIGKFIYKKDTTKNILAFTSGTGNTGYFGLAIILIILGDNALGVGILAGLGFILYENTLGFFLTARGNNSYKQSFMKVIKLPTLHAFILGLIFNYIGIGIGNHIDVIIQYFKGSYILLGMMIIGMSLAHMSVRHIDLKFTSLSFIAKFICRPSIALLIIYFDTNIFHIYNTTTHHILLIMAGVPLAANTVSLATEFDVHPDKAALAVIISTIFALIFIPIIIKVFVY